MTPSPRYSPRGTLTLSHHTESHIVNSAEIDGAKSPHAIDTRDPNYDPFDDDPDSYVDFYMNEETEHLGSVPYHVVQSTKSTPAKLANRFRMPDTPSHSLARELPSLPLGKFKEAAEPILEELLSSNDFAQFTERITKLECKLYHDELIAHVIRISLDKTDADRDIVAELITLARKSGHVSAGQLSRAFEKLFLTWEDIRLDVVDAPIMILRFVELAVADECIPKSFIARLPEAFLTYLNTCHEVEEEFPELQTQLTELKKFKRKVQSILEEYLAGEGVEPAVEIGQQLSALNQPSMHHEFVRRALNFSLDRGEAERELVSSLLSALRDLRILSEDDFLWGFSHLLGSIDDLVLDCPSAMEFVAKFLIRAVTDEVIPPSFLENAIRLGLGESVAKAAQAAIANTEVEWAELRNVWSSPTANKFDQAWVRELELAITEYLASHDKAEFCRLMHGWGLCTSRAIKVVKEGILRAMDGNGNDCMAIVELLEFAVKHEELKTSDILRAMSELDSNLVDLKLDIPDFEDMLNTFGGLLRARNLIPTLRKQSF